MSKRLHVKYPLFLSDFNETLVFFDRFSKKKSNVKFHENSSSESRVVPCGRTDMMKLIVAFRNFGNASKKNTDRQCIPRCRVHKSATLTMQCLYEKEGSHARYG
jgi:hypothetical protein